MHRSPKDESGDMRLNHLRSELSDCVKPEHRIKAMAILQKAYEMIPAETNSPKRLYQHEPDFGASHLASGEEIELRKRQMREEHLARKKAGDE